MKHIKQAIALGVSTMLLGGIVAVTSSNLKEERRVSKADTVETYIQMESAFFTNWTNDAGSFAGTDARFWGENYSFEALDTFFRGETAEGWTGTLTSRTWKQSTQFVYFQLGGARDYDHPDGHAHLVFHYGSYSADFYNNTFVENPMTLRYFKIPDDKFAELMTGHDDFNMYLEIVDPATGGYGFVNFGYLHVNQTEESTSDAMRYFLNNLSTDSREWEVNKRKEIMNTYYDNADQRAVFFRTVSNVDEAFSSNSDFLNHWYFDHNFFNNNYGDARHFDKAIGTDEYRPDANTNMPFNNDGGFFRGWYEGSLDSGFVASDGLRYRFISRPFVLSGTGLISIKMAGKASLHVIDPSVKNTDTQPADLAWIDNKGLSMDGDQANMAASGFNTTAMVNHVINLEAYLGKTIQLAICDVDTSGWSAAYFDSLVSYYASRPGFGLEYATQTNNSGTFYPLYKDIYINSAIKNDGNQFGVIYNGGNSVNTADDNAILNHVDNSASKDAYAFFESYLGYARQNSLGTNLCSLINEDDMKALIGSYNNLSSDARHVVCDSDDYQRYNATSENWSTVAPTILDLGESISYIAQANHIGVTVYGNISLSLSTMLFSGSNTSANIIIAVSALLGLAAICFCFFLKKRKHN